MLDRRRARQLGRRLQRRADLVNWVAGLWALRALSALRRDLPVTGTASNVLIPPRLPPRGWAGVVAVLRRRKATCLERSLVLQKWLLAQGQPYDIVIGVGAPGEAFAAHAWLDGYGFDREAASYQEMMRLPAERAADTADR